jgi:hypothetical protein
VIQIKKKLIIVLLIFSMLFVVQKAHSFIFLAVPWIATTLGVTTQMATAIEVSLYVHGAALAAYGIFYATKGADGKPSGSPGMTVLLNPAAARANPDPAKFNDAAPGARDVTPKSSVSTVSGTSTDPNDAGSAGGTYWETGNFGQGTVKGGSAPGSALQVLTAGYCVGGYASLCELRACTTTVNGAGRDVYSCSGYAKPGTMGCSPQQDGKCYVGVVTATKFTGTPAVTCSSGKFSQNNGACTSYPSPPSTACPAGYTYSNPWCTLSDSSLVKKPITQPCEILRTSSGFSRDSANPNCDSVPVSGNALSPSPDQSLSFNADGSLSMSNPSGTTTLQISPTPNGDGSVNVTGATRSGSPSAYAPTDTPPSTTCGGVGQPSCSATGQSGGSCGGAGQPKCSIDDSGFVGAADPTAAGRSNLDAAFGARTSSLTSGTDKSTSMGIDHFWVPKPGGFSQACEPIPIVARGISISINVCTYINLLSQLMGYLFYIFTGYMIWRAFMKTGEKI